MHHMLFFDGPEGGSNRFMSKKANLLSILVKLKSGLYISFNLRTMLEI